MQKRDLENWVEQYTETLYKWAYHKTLSKENAEDLVQDTFVVAAEKFHDFKGNSSAKTWLFSILNNKIVDFYRKKIKTPISLNNEQLLSFFDEDGNWKENSKPLTWENQEENLLDNLEFKLVLEACIEKLPEKWRFCIRLRYLSGKKGSEICQDLEITPSNFWQIMHRAKLQLRNCIENKQESF